jgi:hypothetical protein
LDGGGEDPVVRLIDTGAKHFDLIDYARGSEPNSYKRFIAFPPDGTVMTQAFADPGLDSGEIRLEPTRRRYARPCGKGSL